MFFPLIPLMFNSVLNVKFVSADIQISNIGLNGYAAKSGGTGESGTVRVCSIPS